METFPLHLHAYTTAHQAGHVAGNHAAQILKTALQAESRARVMLAAAPSQLHTLRTLAKSNLDFARIDFFHMDDYLGLDPDHPVGFGKWLITNFLSTLPSVGNFHRMDMSLPAEDLAESYAKLMGDKPFDVTLCGLGVNAHLAFNDPPADFHAPRSVEVVDLSFESRKQQVDEGHFPDVDSVPSQAATVTIPRLLNAHHIICTVPTAAKRQAVTNTIENEPDPMIPGTALKLHPAAHLYVDKEAYPHDELGNHIL